MSQDAQNNDLIASACRRRHWIFRYREFLLDPGTIFTFASGILLMLAILLFGILGYRYLAVSGDVGMLVNGARNLVKSLHEAIGE